MTWTDIWTMKMPNSLFKYGFCRDNLFSVLRLLFKMFIFKIHVCLPSGQSIVLTFVFQHSAMYIHAIELTVGQLLAFYMYRFVLNLQRIVFCFIKCLSYFKHC